MQEVAINPERLPPGYTITQGCRCLHIKLRGRFLRNEAGQPLVFRDRKEAIEFAHEHFNS